MMGEAKESNYKECLGNWPTIKSGRSISDL